MSDASWRAGREPHARSGNDSFGPWCGRRSGLRGLVARRCPHEPLLSLERLTPFSVTAHTVRILPRYRTDLASQTGNPGTARTNVRRRTAAPPPPLLSEDRR